MTPLKKGNGSPFPYGPIQASHVNLVFLRPWTMLDGHPLEIALTASNSMAQAWYGYDQASVSVFLRKILLLSSMVSLILLSNRVLLVEYS